MNEQHGTSQGHTASAGPTASAGHMEWDCTPWAAETRRLLASLLESHDVPHAWEGTVLVAPAAVEGLVDGLVDDALSTAEPVFGPDTETVTFEVSDWPMEDQNRILVALADAGLPSEWDDEGDLVVADEDADEVEAILTDLAGDTDGDPEGGGEEIDGMELLDRLGAAFVAADRIARDPTDRGAATAFVAAADALDGVALPFGYEPDQWRSVRAGNMALVDVLRRAAADDAAYHEVDGEETVQSVAAEVRDRLRGFV